MNIEEYLEELKGQIRDGHAKIFVTDEIRGHIEEQADAYERTGMPRNEALSRAVDEMGDPISVGTELDRIHRPHMEWRFLLYVIFISTLNIVVMYIINRNMPAATGDGLLQNLSRVSIFNTILGLAVMLVVYRLDYTFLSGKSRAIGLIYLIILAIMSYFCGTTINGMTTHISIGMISVPVFALMLLFLPIFAGILYEYRGQKKAVVIKIVMWMLAPLFIQLIAGYISLPVALFIIFAEILLFIIAFNKNWYDVNKKAVIWCGAVFGFVMVFAVLILIYSFNEYQAARLNNWLAHYGIGSFAPDAYATINYMNNKLSEVFETSSLLGISDTAVATMMDIPSYRSNLILGSIAANCGIISMGAIIFCLFVLSVFVFNISLKQKNSLGSIVGCSCGVAIGLQVLGNTMIVFGLLPMTNSVLPFFASGLSFTLVDYILLGLVLSIYRYKDIRREKASANMMQRRISS